MVNISNIGDQQIVKRKSISERILKLESSRCFKLGKTLEKPALELHCGGLSMYTSFGNMTSP